MNILIIGLKNNEHLVRLQTEGEARGHTVRGALSSELVIRAGRNNFDPTLRGEPMTQYDLIYLWAISTRRWEWYTAAYWLSLKGVKIVYQKTISPDYLYYLTPAIDYLRQHQNNLPFPKSAIVFNAKSVNSILENFEFPLIVKVSEGRQGKGVFKVENESELKDRINELKDVSSSFVIREFIPNDGDVRVFTVGYKAIGAMRRMATREGEFRSNISQGGTGEPFDLESRPEIREIAERLSELTRTEIAGVDIIIHKDTGQPYILEINPGPQFMGLEKFTDVNAALEIIKYFEQVGRK